MAKLFDVIKVERPRGVATRIVMQVRDIELVLRPAGKGGRADISSRSTMSGELHPGATRLTDEEYAAVMKRANGIFFGDR